MNSYSLHHLPLEERPRERLSRFGAEALSTTELIAIILGSGTKTKSVLQLAQDIVIQFGTLEHLAGATLAELCQIKGVGLAKAIQIKAALHLGVRASKQPFKSKFRIEHPVHAYHYVRDEIESEKREVFLAILIDTKGYVITHEVISIGTLSQTLVHPREVFYAAIRHKAASLILAHNHPSGDCTPSQQDYTLTQQLVKAGQLIDLPIQDHLIIGRDCYCSLRQMGFISN